MTRYTIPKPEEILIKIEERLSAEVQEIMHDCIDAIESMDINSEFVDVEISNGISEHSIRLAVAQLQSERWDAKFFYGDVGSAIESIRINAPTVPALALFNKRTEAIRNLFLTCDKWAPKTLDTRGHESEKDPLAAELLQAIVTARNIGIFD